MGTADSYFDFGWCGVVDDGEAAGAVEGESRYFLCGGVIIDDGVALVSIMGAGAVSGETECGVMDGYTYGAVGVCGSGRCGGVECARVVAVVELRSGVCYFVDGNILLFAKESRSCQYQIGRASCRERV